MNDISVIPFGRRMPTQCQTTRFCLSAVDTNTENIILNNLRRIMANRTSVVISHRVSSAKLADHIIMFDDAEVVEFGTHDELLNANGAYRELYEKQLVTEEV